MGLYSTGVIMIVLTYFLTNWLFEGEINLFWSVVGGVVCGVIIGQITEIYTSSDYKSVKEIAEASNTGTATNILAGISVGMKSTVAPVVFICAATMVGVYFGGLFGIACAAVRMFYNLSYFFVY